MQVMEKQPRITVYYNYKDSYSQYLTKMALGQIFMRGLHCDCIPITDNTNIRVEIRGLEQAIELTGKNEKDELDTLHEKLDKIKNLKYHKDKTLNAY
jgi:hypothetical protein